MRHESIRDRARGRWSDILAGIGISSKALRNKHGPCPICGGKDRFRFDDKGGDGTWICNRCGAGDGVKLVMLFLNLDFRDAARKIEAFIGYTTVTSVAPAVKLDNEAKRAEMQAIWSRAKPIDPVDGAGLYLNARTGLVTFPDTLRFSKDERYGPNQFHPAMIARVDPCDEARERGERAALHRTFLDGRGGKAEVPEPRKMLGNMPTGAAIRLMPHDKILGIAEGIETAFAAWHLFDVPVWAAMTAGLLQEWVPPANVEMIFIFGDNDISFTGQAAAYTLARRLKTREGLTVIVEIPPRAGQDWNDLLMAKLRDPARA